jgi:hypothetical protein
MKTTYLRHKLLEHITGKTTYTKPTNTYLALLTADPTIAGTQGQEVSGGSYARQQITWATADDGMIKNSAIVEFTALPSTVVKYWGIFDASTNGNLLEYFPFEVPLIVPSGGDFDIAIGNLILREA